VGFAITVAQVFEDGRRLTWTVVVYLYPIGWLVLAVAGLLGTAFALLRQGRRAGTAERELQAARKGQDDALRERDEALSEKEALDRLLDPDRRRHDTKLLDDIREIIGRQQIRQLDQHDFGNAWRQQLIEPFNEFVDTRWGEPEYRFLDCCPREQARGVPYRCGRLHACSR
jgi:hypothetical protein